MRRWAEAWNAYVQARAAAWQTGSGAALEPLYADPIVWQREQARWERIAAQRRERDLAPVAGGEWPVQVRVHPGAGQTVAVTARLLRRLVWRAGREEWVEEGVEERAVRLARLGRRWAVVRDEAVDIEGRGRPTMRAGAPPAPGAVHAVDDSAMAAPVALVRRSVPTYDRAAAVAYAERWWNGYNPRFRRFADDCTNFISQCLLAGGAPMHDTGNRATGWWYRWTGAHLWSYSWAVSHSLRWYLPIGHRGLRGIAVETPRELLPGDVICYDFEGDGRWNHTTIVVAKDRQGMPLVNAHTTNSRRRYWDYRDSYAWTPQCRYAFFRISV